MAAEVARNAWGIVGHHQQQGILELRWLPASFPTAWFTHRQHALDWLSE
jgi:hypothetical protein